jgi:hypothetical protein
VAPVVALNMAAFVRMRMLVAVFHEGFKEVFGMK